MSLIEDFQRKRGLAQRPAPPSVNVNTSNIRRVDLTQQAAPTQLASPIGPAPGQGSRDEVVRELRDEAIDSVNEIARRPVQDLTAPFLVSPGPAPSEADWQRYKAGAQSGYQASPYDSFEDLMPFAGRRDPLGPAFTTGQTPQTVADNDPNRILGDEFNPLKGDWGQMGKGGFGALMYGVNLLGAVGGEFAGAWYDVTADTFEGVLGGKGDRTFNRVRRGLNGSVIWQALLGRDASFSGVGSMLTGSEVEDGYTRVFGPNILSSQAQELFETVAGVQHNMSPQEYRDLMAFYGANEADFAASRQAAWQAAGGFEGVLRPLNLLAPTIKQNDLDRYGYVELMTKRPDLNLSFKQYRQALTLSARERIVRLAGDFLMPDPADLSVLLKKGLLEASRGVPSVNRLLRTNILTGEVMDVASQGQGRLFDDVIFVKPQPRQAASSVAPVRALNARQRALGPARLQPTPDGAVELHRARVAPIQNDTLITPPTALARVERSPEVREFARNTILEGSGPRPALPPARPVPGKVAARATTYQPIADPWEAVIDVVQDRPRQVATPAPQSGQLALPPARDLEAPSFNKDDYTYLSRGAFAEAYLDEETDTVIKVGTLKTELDFDDGTTMYIDDVQGLINANSLGYGPFLIDHNIDPATGVGYLRMEKAPGRSVQDHILEHPEDTREIAELLIREISDMQSTDLNHNDLHLENVFFDPDTRQLTAIDWATSTFGEGDQGRDAFPLWELLFTDDLDPDEFLAAGNTMELLDKTRSYLKGVDPGFNEIVRTPPPQLPKAKLEVEDTPRLIIPEVDDSLVLPELSSTQPTLPSLTELSRKVERLAQGHASDAVLTLNPTANSQIDLLYLDQDLLEVSFSVRGSESRKDAGGLSLGEARALHRGLGQVLDAVPERVTVLAALRLHDGDVAEMQSKFRKYSRAGFVPMDFEGNVISKLEDSDEPASVLFYKPGTAVIDDERDENYRQLALQALAASANEAPARDGLALPELPNILGDTEELVDEGLDLNFDSIFDIDDIAPGASNIKPTASGVSAGDFALEAINDKHSAPDVYELVLDSDENGQTVGALAYHEQIDGVAYVTNLGSTQKGGGRRMLQSVYQDVLDSPTLRKVQLSSMDDARGFYERMGMTNTSGTTYVIDEEGIQRYFASRPSDSLFDDAPEPAVVAPEVEANPIRERFPEVQQLNPHLSKEQIELLDVDTYVTSVKGEKGRVMRMFEDHGRLTLGVWFEGSTGASNISYLAIRDVQPPLKADELVALPGGGLGRVLSEENTKVTVKLQTPDSQDFTHWVNDTYKPRQSNPPAPLADLKRMDYDDLKALGDELGVDVGRSVNSAANALRGKVGRKQIPAALRGRMRFNPAEMFDDFSERVAQARRLGADGSNDTLTLLDGVRRSEAPDGFTGTFERSQLSRPSERPLELSELTLDDGSVVTNPAYVGRADGRGVYIPTSAASPGAEPSALRLRVMGQTDVPLPGRVVSAIDPSGDSLIAKSNAMSLVPRADGTPVVPPTKAYAQQFSEKYGVPHPYARFAVDDIATALSTRVDDDDLNFIARFVDENLSKFDSLEAFEQGSVADIDLGNGVVVGINTKGSQQPPVEGADISDTPTDVRVQAQRLNTVQVGKENAEYERLLETPGVFEDEDALEYIAEAEAALNDVVADIDRLNDELADDLLEEFSDADINELLGDEPYYDGQEFERWVDTNNTGRFC